MTCSSISSYLKQTMNLFVFPTTIKHYVTGFEVQSTTSQYLFVAKIKFSGLPIIGQISSKKSSESIMPYCKIKK